MFWLVGLLLHTAWLWFPFEIMSALRLSSVKTNRSRDVDETDIPALSQGKAEKPFPSAFGLVPSYQITRLSANCAVFKVDGVTGLCERSSLLADRVAMFYSCS